MKCPICSSTDFGDFRGRRNARCRGCGSFERSRLLWLILQRLPIAEFHQPFLHFAPEIGIAQMLRARLGERYRAFDFQPQMYEAAGIATERFDLCKDLESFTPGTASAVCHVHVLEHVRCNAAFVLQGLNQVLCKGGYHILGVPFFSTHFREDLSPALTDADRTLQFGHEDHVRSFGSSDFDAMFGPAFSGFSRVDLLRHVDTATLEESNVPLRAIQQYSAHSIVVYQKNQ